MKTYARIQSGLVAELFQTAGDITQMFEPSLVWVDCTSVTGVAPGWSYAGGNFTPPAGPTLAAAQAAASAAMNAAAQSAIYAGFTSSALGKPYTYPAKDTDQQNLIASVVDALMNATVSGYTTAFWCADAAGVWAYRPHTAAQIQKVGQDGKAAIMAALTRNAVAQAAIAAATTVAAVNAVTF